jgi:hypothetical protein
MVQFDVLVYAPKDQPLAAALRSLLVAVVAQLRALISQLADASRTVDAMRAAGIAGSDVAPGSSVSLAAFRLQVSRPSPSHLSHCTLRCHMTSRIAYHAAMSIAVADVGRQASPCLLTA